MPFRVRRALALLMTNGFGLLLLAGAVTDVAARVTIDSMKVGLPTDVPQTYSVGGLIPFVGEARTFHLSDGSAYLRGAGYTPVYSMRLHAVEVLGDTITYVFDPPADSVVFFAISYGGISAQGRLAALGRIRLRALAGSTVASVTEQLRVLDNVSTSDGEPIFKYFSCRPGRVVPTRATYTNLSGPWRASSFDSTFQYRLDGVVDFAHPLPPSPLVSLAIRGPRRLAAGSETDYSAIARYGGGLLMDVTNEAQWSLVGASGSTVTLGRVTTGQLPGPEAGLTVRAEFGEPGARVSSAVAALVVADSARVHAREWPMYQANPRHTGYVPVSLSPSVFSPRWSRTVGAFPLNPVAVGDGRVFCTGIVNGGNPGATVFALDEQTGATIWSRDFGASAVNAVNPPSYGDGLLHLQTCNRVLDSWLWSFEAATGEVASRARFETQSNRQYAPTIVGTKVYVNGGQYGGAYRFDGYEGIEDWFTPRLPQYDQWTPAVDGTNAYAYVGIYAPGLYAMDLTTGAVAWQIADPNFDSFTHSVNGAPVLGDQGDLIMLNRGLNSGRLLCFDIANRSLRWVRAGSFKGQPAVARGVVYANHATQLRAFDETTSDSMWAWQVPSGKLSGPVVVTDTHALVSSDSRVYAVNLATHRDDWSFPSPGEIALTHEVLYIATPFGTLHAISLGDQATAALLSRFDAQAEGNVVRLRWRFEDPDAVASLAVERAPTQDGAWMVVPETATLTGADWTLSDPDVHPGESYWYRLIVIDRDGSRNEFGPVGIDLPSSVFHLALGMPMPNPARSAIKLAWSQPIAGRALVTLVDIMGRRVATLADRNLSAGRHTSTALLPSGVAAGLYFLVLEVGGVRVQQRLAIVR